jgi:hypothetical protein
VTQTEAVAKFLKRISDAYVKDQQGKGIRASGRSAASLKEVTEPTGGRLFGKAYFHFQKVGRRPGKFPPINAILTWIEEKGITPADISKKSLAFLIARKIARLGTDIFRGRRRGLNVEEEILEARKELAATIGKIKKDELIQKLNEAAAAGKE